MLPPSSHLSDHLDFLWWRACLWTTYSIKSVNESYLPQTESPDSSFVKVSQAPVTGEVSTARVQLYLCVPLYALNNSIECHKLHSV